MGFIHPHSFLFYVAKRCTWASIKVSTSWLAQDVAHDGNCLFSAIGKSLGISSAELRARVVQWCLVPGRTVNGILLSDWVRWNFDMELPRYLGMMSRNGEWGGAQEMAIISNMLGVAIIVFQGMPKAKRILEVLPDVYDPTKLQAVCILWVGKSHYMQLTPP
jgi:hypothetical protein